MSVHKKGRPGVYRKMNFPLDTGRFPFLLTREQIRERIVKLVAQGWSISALGRAFGWHDQPGQWLSGKLLRFVRLLTPNEQVRVSRALHLIDTGRMKQVGKGKAHSPYTTVLCEPAAPPPPRPTIILTSNGPVVRLIAPTVYALRDLYGRKNP